MARREFTKPVMAQIVLRAKCTVTECNGHPIGLGYCNLHYRRYRRHGSPTGGRKTYKGEPADFLARAVAAHTDECIIWPFAKSSAGYGTIFFNGKYQNVHRLSLTMAKGAPPTPTQVAAHLAGACHNPSCINPKHLRWATEIENAADRKIDNTHLVGERNGASKLTPKQVSAIRGDDRPANEIALDYGVSVRNVGMIRSRSSWIWLDE